MLALTVIGRHCMTEETTNTTEQSLAKAYKKLSIQISLNGLSFCIVDTITNKVVLSDAISFKITTTPYLLLKELKNLLNQYKILGQDFTEVLVIHKNDLFSLVPKALFDEKELANYLKFNAKLLANDHIVFDELENQEMVSVYVPFTNVNNYVFDNFGTFEFKHGSTALIHSLQHQKLNPKPICYAHVAERELELLVLNKKKVVLYNQFQFRTKEDFLYYILFTFEQLHLDLENTKLKLFGKIEEGSELFDICYTYIKKVSVFIPGHTLYTFEEGMEESIDLTLLN